MSYNRMPRFPAVNKLRITVVIISVIVIIVFTIESVARVQAGYRGVVLYLGAVEDRVLGEGIHIVTPFVEQVIQMEVRTQKFEAEASVLLQRICRKSEQ